MPAGAGSAPVPDTISPAPPPWPGPLAYVMCWPCPVPEQPPGRGPGDTTSDEGPPDGPGAELA